MIKHFPLSNSAQNLFQQGFQSFTPKELKTLDWGLRFTPFMCMLTGFFGLITQNIYILFTLASVGLLVAFFPDKHPFDLLYNHLIRHFFGAAKLPPNPLQRRLACLGAGFMNASIAFLFLFDQTTPMNLSEIPWAYLFHMAGFETKAEIAYFLGFSLLAIQIIVFINHFCLLSWGYEKIISVLSLDDQPVTPGRAIKFYKMGAKIIDVRSKQEYENGHVNGAVNVPLETFSDPGLVESLSKELILVYSKCGKLSHIAQEILRNKGATLTYNLGDFRRARKIIASSKLARI